VSTHECDSCEALAAQVAELRDALDRAHKIFGSESDKLGALVKGLTEQNEKYRAALEMVRARVWIPTQQVAKVVSEALAQTQTKEK